MPTDLDRSRVTCRVCAAQELLPADGVAVTTALARFSVRHTHADAFHVDVVVADHSELPDAGPFPRQRAYRSYDEPAM